MPSTIFVRVALTLCPSAQERWPAVAMPVMRWLIQEERAPIPQHVAALLLQQGGEFDADEIELRTAAHADAAGQMLAWALSYAWREPRPSPRCWRIDVGFVRRDAEWDCSLAIRHGLAVEYVGPPLPPPPFRVPALLPELLRNPRWSVPGVGEFPMAEHPHALPLGRGHILKTALADPQRRYPIVYVSRLPTGGLLTDVGHLARTLAGSAVVLVAEAVELDIELDWLLPIAFKCVGGALRVYFPGLRLDDDTDAVRHRYLAPETLVSMGATVPAHLGAAIMRWAESTFSEWLTTPADVRERVREARLEALRAQELADGESLQEYVRLMEEENAHLRTQIQTLGAQFDEIRQEIAQTEDLKARLSALTYEHDRDRQALQMRVAHEAQTAQQQNILTTLRELPETLPATLELIARLFPARVVVLPRAIKSAERAMLERARDGRLGWRPLHALATTLYDLVFADPPIADLETAFAQQSGLEVAFGEGKQTNRNDRMMAQRREVDDRGQSIDITPHIKLGDRAPRLLRIHFAIDRERQRLIIGHCGDHLETFGTQWNG